MSMGNEHCTDTVPIFFDIGKIRDHQIDSQHVVIRECQAAVYNKNIVATLICGHILSNFIEAA